VICLLAKILSQGNLRYLRTTVILCFIWGALSYAYSGFSLWLPDLLTSKGIDKLGTYENLLYMAAAEVPGLLLATALVDKLGRKPVLGLYLLIMGVSVLVFAFVSAKWSLILCSMLVYFGVVLKSNILFFIL